MQVKPRLLQLCKGKLKGTFPDDVSLQQRGLPNAGIFSHDFLDDFFFTGFFGGGAAHLLLLPKYNTKRT